MAMVRIRVAGAALAFATALAGAAEAGSFGFGVNVDAESFSWNPTLRAVKVESVVPGSAAAKAGLLPGDRILEVQGIVIAGAKASDLKAVMRDKAVGDTLRMKIQHPGGEPVETTLTATPKS